MSQRLYPSRYHLLRPPDLVYVRAWSTPGRRRVPPLRLDTSYLRRVCLSSRLRRWALSVSAAIPTAESLFTTLGILACRHRFWCRRPRWCCRTSRNQPCGAPEVEDEQAEETNR